MYASGYCSSWVSRCYSAHCIEAANPRHEPEWQVWQTTKLPAGRILIPGVVSHCTNVVEHPELVAWRLGNSPVWSDART
jgi:methionine synthase II (cobalamin-independent)